MAELKWFERVLHRGFGSVGHARPCSRAAASAVVLSLGQPEVIKALFNYALIEAAWILNTYCPIWDSFDCIVMRYLGLGLRSMT